MYENFEEGKTTSVDDNAKKGGQLSSELFIMIFYGPDFVGS